MKALLRCTLAAWCAALSVEAGAQKQYGPGVTDTEILIGQTMPYAGPASVLGHLGRAAQAYFEKINASGGVNGRRIRLLSLDDAYTPPRTLEGTRRLVEQDNVLLIYQTVGTATNSAIHKYLNGKKVPQLLITTGASKWNDPKAHPWTLSGMPTYATEGRIYARHLLATRPDAKVAVLMQNDDFGRDYLDGFKAGLGDKAPKMIVATATYESMDPTVDSQVVSLKTSGADVFLNLSNAKFTVQSIRKSADLGWKPLLILPLGSSSIGSILKPAGAQNAVGAITVAYGKNPADPQWQDDAGMKAFLEFMKQYMPKADPHDQLYAGGYSSAQILVQILRQSGDNLTRENVMKQALSLRNFATETMLPGLSVNTSPQDYELFDRLVLQRFDGTSWVPFGQPVSR